MISRLMKVYFSACRKVKLLLQSYRNRSKKRKVTKLFLRLFCAFLFAVHMSKVIMSRAV